MARISCHIAHSLVENRRIWSHLGWRDLKVRYAATWLGPWWSVTNLTVVVSASSLAVSLISKSALLSTVPRVAIGFILWTFISSSVVEATSSLEQSKGLLLNTQLHEILVVYRLVWRNLVIFIHNFVIVLMVLLILDPEDLLNIFALLPILAIVAFSLIFPVLVVSRIVYWKPAMRSLIPPAMQFLFYLTPVLWAPPSNGPGKLLVEINPIAWVLQLAENAVLHAEIHWEYLLRTVLLVIFSLLVAEFLVRRFDPIKKYL